MTRKHESTETRQQQIVDAARRVIIKYGSERVTVKRITHEVGISEAAVYRHFKSKKQILSLLAEQVGDTLMGDIARATVRGRTPLKTLESALRSHLSAIEQRRGVSFQVVAEIVSLGDKRLNREMSRSIDNYISRIANLLSRAVKSGEVREDIDTGVAATVLFGMIQGLVTIWALGNYGFDLRQRYVSVWHIFREAVAKQESRLNPAS